MKQKKIKLSLFVIMVMFISACAINQATYEKNIYKTLSMAATTYEETMSALGDAYKKGLINDSDKKIIIEKANIYWKTYHSAVLAYEIYIRQKTNENKNKLETLVRNMNNSMIELLKISQSNLNKGTENE